MVATADGRAVPAAGVFTSQPGGGGAGPGQPGPPGGHRGPGRGRHPHVGQRQRGDRGRRAAPRQSGSAPPWPATWARTAEEILVCQTGLIGIPFPIDAVIPEIAPIVMARSGGPEAGTKAARAIMTTDTVPKEVVVAGDGFTVGRHGQGRGDAGAEHGHHARRVHDRRRGRPGRRCSRRCREAVAASFNAITVDGCTSTNDTVLVLASGLGASPSPAALTAALTEACRSLAEQMVDDAEGATKVAHVHVRGRAERRGRARRGAQGGRLHARAVLALRRGPLLGAHRLRARLGRDALRHRPGVGGLRRHRGVRRRCGRAARRGGGGRPHGRPPRRDRLRPRASARAQAVVLGTDLGYGYIDENRTTS